MYTRTANGKEIELRGSGKLYKDALVMFDRQTGTLWTQVDGKALRGPLAGQRLEELPATRTTWKAWKTLHPNTLVLSKPLGLGNTSYYKYFSDQAQCGLSGTHGDSRLDGKTLVVGLHSGDQAVAIPVATLEKKRLVQTELGGEPVIVFYSQEDQAFSTFRATVGGQRLSFHLRGHGEKAMLEDEQTHSRWSPLEGRAISGTLKEKRLDPVLSTLSYWYAWSAYRPQTQLLLQP